MQLTTEQLQKFNITPQMVELGISYDGVDLKCDNFESFEHHKLMYTIQMFDIFGLGGKAYSQIAKQLNKQTDFFFINDNIVILNKLKNEIGPSKTQTLVKGINTLIENGIPLWKIIIGLQVEDCGTTIAKQFANYYTNEIAKISKVDYDFKGLTKIVIEELKNQSDKLTSILQELTEKEIKIIYPLQIEKKIIDANTIYYVLTGSPKEFGYKTKSEFQKELPENWIEQKGLDKNTTFLITDDIESSSSKTIKAKKLGINIVTYDIDIYNPF